MTDAAEQLVTRIRDQPEKFPSKICETGCILRDSGGTGGCLFTQ